jgi:hypothetical protein
MEKTKIMKNFKKNFNRLDKKPRKGYLTTQQLKGFWDKYKFDEKLYYMLKDDFELANTIKQISLDGNILLGLNNTVTFFKTIFIKIEFNQILAIRLMREREDRQRMKNLKKSDKVKKMEMEENVKLDNQSANGEGKCFVPEESEDYPMSYCCKYCSAEVGVCCEHCVEIEIKIDLNLVKNLI